MERTDLDVYGFVHPDEDTWILRMIGYTTNPLPLNGSRGATWHRRAKVAAQVRRDAGYIARHAHIPLLDSCRVQLTWWVTTNRTRDVDNLAAFEKPIYDGLVDARVAPDDSPAFMDKLRPAIRPLAEAVGLLTGPGFTVTITRTDQPDEF